MILTLEVITPPGGTAPAEERRVFRASGGTIGRVPGNDWILPDSYVSSRHARIIYANGVFQVEDTSTNGVFINSADNRLVRGRPQVLKSGDRILIDPYEIRVSIAGDAAREEPIPALVGDDPFGPSEPPPRIPGYQPVSGLPEPVGGADVDPLSLLNLDPGRAPAPSVPRAADLARGSLLNEHYRPPAVPPAAPAPPPQRATQSGTLIPDDYDPLKKSEVRPRFETPRPTPRPIAPDMTPPRPVQAPAASPFDSPPVVAPPPVAVPPPVAAPPPVVPRPAAPAPPPAAREGSGVDLRAVLEGAGVPADVITPELARDFGRILRVVVEGLMDVLQARQRIKDEFRMHMTSFKPTQNNPLKFSANVDDALHNLLVKRNAAYLGSVDAFADAFDDVRHHQMAMLAGVRVAFEAMLKSFDPEKLQKEFDRQGKGSLFAGPGKLRYWDQYSSRFSDMVSDADACFRELFGHEFAKAYEEQLERLKAQERPGRSR